jgi:hypothetical protein
MTLTVCAAHAAGNFTDNKKSTMKTTNTPSPERAGSGIIRQKLTRAMFAGEPSRSRLTVLGNLRVEHPAPVSAPTTGGASQ